MADIKNSEQPNLLGVSDQPVSRKVFSDPTHGLIQSDSERFTDRRIIIGTHVGETSPEELAKLLIAYGFEVESKILSGNRLSLAVERRDVSTDPEKLPEGSDSSAIDPGTDELSRSGAHDLAMGPFGSYHLRDAGLFSYTFGMFGAAAFMATGIGPGWLGFFAVFLPVSLFASWAVSAHA